MAQKSYLWTTGSAGDGASAYTRFDWTHIAKIFTACHAHQGVAPVPYNALTTTYISANTIRVQGGYALVDGKPYLNDSTLDITIPSAVGGGNTRIDRLVLRADWTAQTVRLYRLAGVDAASPTVPVLTQQNGSLWELPLYQCRVDTLGVVTLTDERVMSTIHPSGIAAATLTTSMFEDGSVTQPKLAANSVGTQQLIAANVTQAKMANNSVGTAQILDGNVTLAKMAANSVGSSQLVDGNVVLSKMAANSVGTSQLVDGAVTAAKILDGTISTAELADLAVTLSKLAADSVDDTKVGNRVPQFYRRQGGSATSWLVQGNTTYTPTTVRMQAGVYSHSTGGIAQSMDSGAVTFPVAFSQPPICLMVTKDPEANIAVTSTSTTQGFYTWQVLSTAIDIVDIIWLAIGPE